VSPFAAVGGLADVVGALPRALAQRGVSSGVVMPFYGEAVRLGLALDPATYAALYRDLGLALS
jgi:glycogen synthase